MLILNRKNMGEEDLKALENVVEHLHSIAKVYELHGDNFPYDAKKYNPIEKDPNADISFIKAMVKHFHNDDILGSAKVKDVVKKLPSSIKELEEIITPIPIDEWNISTDDQKG